jgi:hypothetical protein
MGHFGRFIVTECKYKERCKLYPNYEKCTHLGIQQYKYNWDGAKPDTPSDEHIRNTHCEIYVVLNNWVNWVI